MSSIEYPATVTGVKRGLRVIGYTQMRAAEETEQSPALVSMTLTRKAKSQPCLDKLANLIALRLAEVTPAGVPLEDSRDPKRQDPGTLAPKKSRRRPSTITPKAQRKEPYVIRLKRRDIERLQALARVRGLGHTTVAREVLLHGLKMAEVEEALKTDVRITA